jgi:general secretion pathway protein G
MLERIREARRNESGFTLIELLIVIVILGVLAGIVVFAVSGINDDSKTSACKSDKKNVEIAAEAYYAQNKSYPADATAAEAALVPGYLHSWPSDTVIGWTRVAAAAGPPAVPVHVNITATNNGTTC